MPPQSPPRELVAGRFEVQRRIGAGGMAQVFLARRVSATGTATTSEPAPGSLADFVVLKMILPALAKDTRVVELFLEEARLVSMLNHPNIVDVVGVGAEAGVPFIAMEYLHGQNLRRVAVMAKRRHGSIPLDIAIEIVSRAAAGLHYAHTRDDAAGRPLRIVHRDVTPHNIVFTYDGRIKLIDFGIAKASSQVREPTQVGEIRGKLRYLAPEQALSQRLDARTDVFALGVTLYELTTMQRAFPQSTEESVIVAVSRGELVKPSSIVEGYPPVLENIVRRATAAKPADRFQTAAELGAALDDAVVQLKQARPTQERMSTYVRELFKPEIERSMVGKLEGSRAGEPTAVRANPWARPPEKSDDGKPVSSPSSEAATHIQAQSSTSSDEAKEVTDPIVPVETAEAGAAGTAGTAGEMRDEPDDDTALGWQWLGEDPRVSIPSADTDDVIAIGSTTAPTVPRPGDEPSRGRLDAGSRSVAFVAIAAVAGLLVAALVMLAFGADDDDVEPVAPVAPVARSFDPPPSNGPPDEPVHAVEPDAPAVEPEPAAPDRGIRGDAARARPKPTATLPPPPPPPTNGSYAAAVAWLDANCVGRVVCAADVVARKKTIANASLDEVRAFPGDVASCVRQCTQQR